MTQMTQAPIALQSLFCQSLISSFDTLPFPVLITAVTDESKQPDCLYANQAFETMTGFKLSELEDDFSKLLASNGIDSSPEQALEKALISREKFDSQITLQTKNNQPFTCQWQLSPLADSDTGEIFAAVSYLLPVVTPVEKNFSSDQQGKNDKTQLYQEHKAIQIIEEHLNQSPVEQLRDMSLIAIELENNDEQIVNQVAAIIKSNLRSEDIVSHWQKRGFLALIQSEVHQTFYIAENLKKALLVETKQQPVPFNLGVTNLTRNDDCELLFERVSKALYQAQKSGQNQIFSIQA